MMNAKTTFYMKIGVPVVSLVVGLILLMSTAGINDAGQRTVIQAPNGTMIVKFEPGFYFSYFGKTTEYNDLITFDFDRNNSEGGESTLDQSGINVRYRDGGMGSVYGKGRFSLPSDKDTMITLHKAFRSNAGLANKLIKPVTEEAMNLTAGLMNSEDAYDTQRAVFIQWSKAQIAKGKFQTTLDTITTKDEVTGKTVRKQIPVPALDKNQMQIHLDSDLVRYGVTLEGFQLNDPGFEETTRIQIAEKRAATMAIITAKANAEKAKQMAITAEEDGKAAVMKAKYIEEVEKERAVVVASREAEVAVINAERKVDVAEQAKLEALVVAERKVDVAAQSKLEAEQYKYEQAELKEANILEGEGLAQKKRLIYEADGALTQKLNTYENVMANFATEFGKQKWVPEVMMGATGGSGGNEAANLITLLTANSLKDLGLKMEMNNAVTQ